MPVTKYFAKVWSSPKQKDQILLKYDPAAQRTVRVGCKCNLKIIRTSIPCRCPR